MSRAPVPSPRPRRLALRTGAIQPPLPTFGLVVDPTIVIFAVDAELSLQCVMTGIVMLMDLWQMLHYSWSACRRPTSSMACDSQCKALYLRFGSSARRAARVARCRGIRRPHRWRHPRGCFAFSIDQTHHVVLAWLTLCYYTACWLLDWIWPVEALMDPPAQALLQRQHDPILVAGVCVAPPAYDCSACAHTCLPQCCAGVTTMQTNCCRP